MPRLGKTIGHLFYATSSFVQILYFTLKIQGQGHGQGQTRWSHSSPRVQLICLLSVSWQSDHFWLRYSKFYIWPWKFKVKVMAKVKPDGHIWALEFNWYVCFLFHGNRNVFGRDIANSIFDLEKSRSRSQRKLTKIYSGNLQVRANNHAKNERNSKSCSKIIAWTRICGRWGRTNRYKNIKLPLVFWGGLIIGHLSYATSNFVHHFITMGGHHASG